MFLASLCSGSSGLGTPVNVISGGYQQPGLLDANKLGGFNIESPTVVFRKP
jgi:hypothetical protein